MPDPPIPIVQPFEKGFGRLHRLRLAPRGRPSLPIALKARVIVIVDGDPLDRTDVDRVWLVFVR